MKTEDFFEFCAQFKTQGLDQTLRQTIFNFATIFRGIKNTVINTAKNLLNLQILIWG